MLEPRLILLDEPSIGLDPKAAAPVFETIIQLNRERSYTILLVEQNARAGLGISHTGAVMDAGTVVLEAPGAELLADPKMAELYLGGRVAPPPPAEPPSAKQAQRLLDQPGQSAQELRAARPVHHPVVEAERDLQRRTHDGRAVERNHAVGDPADRQDRRLRRVHDGVKRVDAVHPEVRDGKGAALDIGRPQPSLAGRGDELLPAADDLFERHVRRVVQDRHHERLVGGHRDADVDAPLQPGLAVLTG